MAVGLIIPMFSPIKIILEPASFTLASHVAIFIAMFISPGIAVTVALGTTVGFFLGGFPIIVVFRAASHVIFAYLGALYLHKIRNAGSFSAINLRVFSFSVAIVHALGELIVVSVFFFGERISDIYYQQGFARSVLLLLGLGTIIHSMIDFELANAVRLALKKQINIEELFIQKSL